VVSEPTAVEKKSEKPSTIDEWQLRSEFTNKISHALEPVRKDIRCDLADGCYGGTYVWVSHKLKALYFETPKAASSSIVRAFGMKHPFLWLRYDDIEDVLPIEYDTRPAVMDAYGEGAANTIALNIAYFFVAFGGRKHRGHRLRRIVDSKASRILDTKKGRYSLRNRIKDLCKAEDRDGFGFEVFYGTPSEAAEEYGRYFKFSVVRNPWDRMVSNYGMFCRSGDPIRLAQIEKLFGIPPDRISFQKFVEMSSGHRNHHWEQYVRYLPMTSSGTVMLDVTATFETIGTDWKRVQEALGIDVGLGHHNKSSHNDYRTYYDEETKAAVEKEFQEDIEAFGFCF
jgi:hypothetical protein